MKIFFLKIDRYLHNKLRLLELQTLHSTILVTKSCPYNTILIGCIILIGCTILIARVVSPFCSPG